MLGAESIFGFEFMQRAFAMAIVSGLACGMLGVFVVLLRMSFIGICVSHAAFAGALLGVWMGMPPLACGFAGAFGATALVGPSSRRLSVSKDTIVGVIFSVMLSLSMLVLGLLPGSRTEGLNFLWGNLLTATYLDLAMMSICCLLLIAFIILFYTEIEAMISQRDASEASGIPVRTLSFAVMCMMGCVIAVALKAVGGVLIYALIVTPAATAIQTTRSLKTMFLLAAFWGVLASLLGLYVAYWLSLPTGATVVLTATLLLVLTRLTARNFH